MIRKSLILAVIILFSATGVKASVDTPAENTSSDSLEIFKRLSETSPETAGFLSLSQLLETKAYRDAGFPSKVVNSVGDTATLINYRPEMITLKLADATEIHAAILTVPDTMTIVAENVFTPTPVGRISLFGSDMKLAEAFAPSYTDWLVNPKMLKGSEGEDIEREVPFILARVTVLPELNRIEFTNEMAAYYPKGQMPESLNSFHKKLVYKVEKGKLKRIKE